MPSSARHADILVVDDDPDTCHGLARLLERDDYSVAAADG